MGDRHQYLIHFGYDGSRFWGLAPQPVGPTAGATLFDRLQAAAGQRPRALQFTARTDRGVHAVENLATCWFLSPFEPDVFEAAVMGEHDDGLRDVWVEAVDIHVHARALSRGKHYRYTIRQAEGEATDAWCIGESLDVTAMQEASVRFVGRHDFASFRFKQAEPDTMKTLTRVEVTHDGADIHIDIEGDGFLRQMIRRIVTALVEVGRGGMTSEQISALLASPVKRGRPPSSPAQGLCLVAVLRRE